MERARQLLAACPPGKLRAIAAACGFSDVERVRLVFVRVTGHTPAEYRRERASGAIPAE